ncbi:hypothetical protein P5G50_10760 [Leifsonia sp. F6_8S_P_1B]|uniref:Uncharacterized protein n=1 Tax=Leifsonia williamsii TaxID=3035919 RepID=A0ABT8KBU3_9MICO|nr:hypothetical protein [Leifsonia williamsii]MDN4614931.1 hypothetical protein [Leifsonia williamsii]
MTRDRRTTAATVLAVVALVGATALVGYDVSLATRSTGWTELGVLATHLLFGWIPAVVALIGVALRRSRLTVVALIVAVAALVVPPVVALMV